MEYEYSFNVKDIRGYVDYCKEHSYELMSDTRQIRTIYRNNGLMARITQDIAHNKKIYTLDFKEDKLNNNDLIIRKESKKIVFDNISNCENILEFLEYKKDNTLDRTRYVYEKGNVEFEIDIYSKPTKTFVVAIEGKKNEVDKVFSDLEDLNKLYKI